MHVVQIVIILTHHKTRLQSTTTLIHQRSLGTTLVAVAHEVIVYYTFVFLISIVMENDFGDTHSRRIAENLKNEGNALFCRGEMFHHLFLRR